MKTRLATVHTTEIAGYILIFLLNVYYYYLLETGFEDRKPKIKWGKGNHLFD